MNSISALVKMHARHLRIWLYLHQHKLPWENKAQLISGSLICLDGNEFLIDLVVRRIMQEHEAAGCSHSGLLWRCVLVASRQQCWPVSHTHSKEQDPRGAEGTSCQETPQHRVLLATDLAPSYLCTLAWFATALQIISFNLPITQTWLKTGSFEKFHLFDMKPIFWFFKVSISFMTEN